MHIVYISNLVHLSHIPEMQQSASCHSNATAVTVPNDHLMNIEHLTAARNGSVHHFEIILSTQNSPETIFLSHTSHRKDTLLHIAAVFGQHQLTKFLADKYQDLITCKNFIGDTPLHVGARAGKLLVVKALALINVPPNDFLLAVNDDLNTPLHEAVIHNRDEVVEFLLRRIPDFKRVMLDVNNKGKSILHLAVESGNASILKNILNHSIDTSENGINEHGETRESILHTAITRKYIESGNHAQNLGNISNPSIAVDESDQKTESVLHAAITVKDIESGNYAQNLGNISNPSIAVDESDQKTESVLHAAITVKDIGILRMVGEKVVGALPDENNHLLHLAASLGFLDGLKYLLEKFRMDVLRYDKDGFCPIHLACKYGHLQVIKELLNHYPDAREFLSIERQNILHVAAENGKNNVVKYILKCEWSELLLNEKDGGGYTPLHLATMNWHPKVVSTLTWDDRVDLKQVNKEGLTVLEVAEKSMKEMAPFKQRLTWIALRSAGTPRAQMKDKDTVRRLEAAKYEPYNMDYCKDRVNTLLLVSALVATVTFAAGFTMPGGSNSSGSQHVHVGMASMRHKIRFRLFVICDSVAVYSSIIVAVMLMWAQLGDLDLLLNALRKAQRLLGLSLAMMSLAFLAGVNLVVTDIHSLSIVILVMGITSLIILLALFIPLFLPYTSKMRICRYISYYPFKLLMLAS